ncbi:lytic transglycosylase domain-containing protein [Pontibacter akesuensis]|uniref:Membrane-bound lytic murein transglycosylase D n=1 Tax=Pontibacter akesuensis TaxID=388950 RepID=A0A1I7KA03_9BACT|nr:lytic transglycosylase domain-containing protein [Pontibacter akesuensis]GHA73832.1 lytic transglycosylase [Pontibacter akesuensis]SFU94242.1 membrane-bound lytic murein transglycosylase D [Pontibacter akesuensis]
MTYSKFFTLLAAMAGSIWAVDAQAASHSLLFEAPLVSPKDSLKPGAVQLTPEELALLVEIIPNEPDEVIADRLSCLDSEIPLVFNNYVRNFIDYFTIRNRKYTRTMLQRENVYFPLFEKYLKKYDMPDELKYLSIVESGLSPKAQSPVGAAGLWQFMKPTGREYGLEQTSFTDERLDPEKSTDAAMRFLRRLHKYYDGDWELALAAYNCGQGNVNKAIRRAGGGKKTFWEIFPYLPRETRGYVPSMTAVRYAMNYAGEHNIFSDSILYAPQVDYLEVTQAMDLEKLAWELHLTPGELMALNPEITKTKLPDQKNNYKLRVPANRAALLASAADKRCILMAAAPVAPQPKPQETPVMLAAVKKEAEPATETEATSSLEKTTYTVQRGDNLTQIAQRHNVTIEQLKEWNNLASNKLMPEQKLQLLQPAQAAEPVVSTPVVLASNKTTTKETPAKQIVQPQEQLIHHVQPGDTLWQISRKYNGIPVEQIKKLNNLKDNAIKPGQKLILS